LERGNVDQGYDHHQRSYKYASDHGERV
jgi:hypothetical protein